MDQGRKCVALGHIDRELDVGERVFDRLLSQDR